MLRFLVFEALQIQQAYAKKLRPGKAARHCANRKTPTTNNCSKRPRPNADVNDTFTFQPPSPRNSGSPEYFFLSI